MNFTQFISILKTTCRRVICMKYKYRGQLNNGKMVDIFDFDGQHAKCDHNIGKIHIDDFNSMIVPRETFKKEFLGMEVKEVKIEKEKEVKSK